MILLLLIVAGKIFAQVQLEGIVKDSIGTPLELANVMAIDQDSKNIEAFAITNDKGKFKILLGKNKEYKLQISYVGMKTFEEILSTGTDNISKNITLLYDDALDAVELVYEMPVTIKGDTIVYNADSFKDGTERKLKDILKNMPGIEVDESGNVKVEGKDVKTLMVEGKKFFDGDSKLATNNIPANAVDKVEVLKNFSEIRQLKHVEDNEGNVALNIKLKEGKKKFWFGNITAGSGVAYDDGLYVAKPRLFYYSPKYSANIIGDLNNVGEPSFTILDYLKFTGFDFGRGDGTQLSLGSDESIFLGLQNNMAKEINTKFGAANFNYSPIKPLDINGFGIFSSNNTLLEQNSSVVNTDSDLGIPDEETSSNTNQYSGLGLYKLNVNYSPNKNKELQYKLFGKIANNNQSQNEVSSVIGTIEEYKKANPFSIDQSLNYYYTTPNDKNIFALESKYLISDEDPYYNALLDNDPTNNNSLNSMDSFDETALGLGLDRSLDNYNIVQRKRVKTNQFKSSLNYWYLLNRISDINFALGATISSQKFDSQFVQFLEGNEELMPTPSVNDGLSINDVAYNFRDYYIGVNYRIKSGIFTFKSGIFAHKYNLENTQQSIKQELSFSKFLPQLKIRAQLKRNESLVLDYKMQADFPNIINLAQGLFMNNYGSYTIGTPTLKNGISHNVDLRYTSFNQYNFTSVTAMLSYRKLIGQVRTRSNYESIIRTSSFLNSPLEDNSFTAYVQYGKTVGRIKGTLEGKLDFTEYNRFIEDRVSLNKSFAQDYSINLNTQFRRSPNVGLSYRYRIEDNQQGTNNLKYYSKSVSGNFRAYLLRLIKFKTDFSYTDVSDETNLLNKFKIWNASLSYRKSKDAKLEYELRASNLLDTKSITNTGSSGFSIYRTEYFIQPRFVTFRLRYEI